MHPHFPFIYLTISILGSSIIFGLSLKYTLRFVPSSNQVLYDDELKDFVAKIEQHGLYEKFKKLLKRKIDTSPTDPITEDEVSLVH